MNNALYSFILFLIFIVVYVSTYIYMLVDSRKYPNTKILLWAIVNLFLPFVGFIGYMIEVGCKKSAAN